MDEEKFQSEIRETEWFKEFTKEYGEEPNLDDPDYDYRAAWAAGVRPERYEHDGGRFHWPSNTPDGKPLKSENHPTKWMEDFMQKTGRDPNSMGIRDEQMGRDYLDQISRPKTKIIEYLTQTDRPDKSMEQNAPTYSSIFQAIRSIFPKEQPQPVNKETIHPRPEERLDDKFYSQLAKHEGFSAKVYKDTEGFDTIGYGHKVRPGEDWSKGITREEAKLLLQQDAAEAIRYARTLPYWEKLDDRRKNVVAEMIFNLGFEGFKKFKKTNQLLEQGKFNEAAKEMLNSKWAKQVKGRAITLANQMKE